MFVFFGGFIRTMRARVCVCVFQCEHIAGLGFRRGSYKCVCKDGFYFPDPKAERRYYEGTIVEEQYERKRKVRHFSVAPLARRERKVIVQGRKKEEKGRGGRERERGIGWGRLIK